MKRKSLIVTTKDRISFQGSIEIPASKSQAQRAIALALINKGVTQIKGLGFCDDEKAALSIVENAGAKVISSDGITKIFSNGFKPNNEISVNVGESGLSSRMFTPILANSENTVIIEGHGSLLTRPMDFFFNVFPELSVSISSKNNKIPIKIKGPLKAKNISVDGTQSSQYITGLVYGFIGSDDAAGKKIEINQLKSRPYFELSLEALEQFGVKLSFQNDIVTFPNSYKLSGNHAIQIEGDWSSASFFIVGAAIRGSLELTNLNQKTKQADIAIIQAVKQFGCNIKTHKNSITVESLENNAFNFDATDCPDLFPPLAVLAVFAKGTSRIQGLHRLKHKESDRGEGIKSTFRQLGVIVELDYQNDTMLIQGGQKVKGGKVYSLNDHRMAMALTIIGLISGEQVIVTNADAINKSFPTFYELLLTLADVLKIE